jgi:hypothetical protein
MSSSLQQALAQAAKSLGTHVSGQIGQFAQQDVQNRQQLQYNTLAQQQASQQQANQLLSRQGLEAGQVALNKDRFVFTPSSTSIAADALVGAAGGAAEGGSKAAVAAMMA